MTTMRPATPEETDAWSAGWQARLHSWFDGHDMSSGSVTALIGRRLSQLATAAERAVCAVVDDTGTPVGAVAVVLPAPPEPGVAYLLDVWVEPDHRRRGHGRAAVAWAQEWGAARGARLALGRDPADPGQMALLAGFPVRARQMAKSLSGPRELPAGVIGRPMTEDEFAVWQGEQKADYAREMVNSGLLTPGEARQRSAEQFNELLPQGLATAAHSFHCVEAADEVVGTVWIGHGHFPEMSWVYGVEVAERHRGRGYGRAAMTIGEQVAADAGDGWIGLNVFGHNDVAAGLYRSMGYDTFEERCSAED